MRVEQCTTRDETEAENERHYRCRDRQRAWRKWREKAEAWDPERWKAMAATWASMWQDWTGEPGPERSADTATKSCPYCAEVIKPSAIRCKHCGTWLADPPQPLAHVNFLAPTEVDAGFGNGYGPSRRLTRSTGDAMAFGVLSGLGHFFGIDPTLFRVAYALGTFFTAIVPGVLVYLMLALIVPRDVPVKGQYVE
jgi:phage shock protein PspC (stress-responsive transcriptional regulator)